MPTEEKVRRVAELAERLESSAAVFLTEYRGLTVSEISELRRSLRDADASFSVVKNTIMERAATAAGRGELTTFLSGPSAVAFVDGDAVAAAKALTGIAKRFPALVLKGGWMDGRPLTADEANQLAELESREAMLSKIAGLAKTEMVRAASMFQAAQAQFLSLLEAYREKLPSAADDGSGGEAATSDVDDVSDDAPAPEAAADEHSASEEEAAPEEPPAQATGETAATEAGAPANDDQEATSEEE